MMDTKTEEISLEKEGTQHHDKYKTREDLEKEVLHQKRKTRLIKCQLQQTQSQMELQGLRTKQLVKAWQTRVEDAEDKNRKYKHKRDRELLDINSQLMYLQGQLKLEQQQIQTQLASKDKTISQQNEEITQLKTENKQLAEKLVSKRRRNKKFNLENLETSLDNLTRYDSGLGFNNTISESGVNYSDNSEFLEFQKAYDTIKHRYTTTDSFASSQTNMSEMTAENNGNITEDDVFLDADIQLNQDKAKLATKRGSYSDLIINTGVPSPKNSGKLKTMFRRHSEQNMVIRHHSMSQSQIYANPKIIQKNKKKFDSLPHKLKESTKTEIQQQQPVPKPAKKVKSKHMSIDIDVDLGGSFDSVKFIGGGGDEKEKKESHWYSSDNDDNKADTSSNLKQDSLASISTHSFDRKQGGSFFRDIFNTLRHKTVRRKRKRSMSLSASSKMPTIFLTQSEPDIPHAEVNIDEAIYKKLRNKNLNRGKEFSEI